MRIMTTGMMTTTSTPLRRKIGVRFMILHSRARRARNGLRPDETRRDISADESVRRRALVSPIPTRPR
jgi:hypothetical protein